MNAERKYLRGNRERRFLAIQNFLVPKSLNFTEAQKHKSLNLVDSMLVDKSAKMVRQFFVFLAAIDILSFFIGFSKFASLSEQKKKSLMNFLFNCPLTLLRKGFWGLNTLCKLGVYAQEDFYDEIGYDIKEVSNH